MPVYQSHTSWFRIVTLSAAKGLGVRFFAALRMTVLKGLIIKCTNVLHSGLEKVTARDMEKLGSKVVQVRHQQPHSASEVIVGHHRRNGGCQPDRSSDQSFSDPRCDCLQARRLDRTETLESGHDPPHSAE